MDAADALVKTEWVTTEALPRRFKFRRDGTGYYEREAPPGERPVYEKLLYRLDGERLHVKLAHARLWTDVAFTLTEGTSGERLGARRLELAEDPYFKAILEEPSTPFTLLSDAGVALPG